MRTILNLYKYLFQYPDENFHFYLKNLISNLENYQDETLAKYIEKIKYGFKDLGSTELKELYSHTFDWNPSTCLYMGYYLFGESYFRSTFLIKLTEAFEFYQFQKTKSEMSDHLSILLDFSANYLDDTDLYDFLETVILLSLDKFLNSQKLDEQTIEKSFSEKKSYYYLLKSLHYLLASYSSKEIIITTI